MSGRFRVEFTDVADQDFAGLRGRTLRRVEQKLDELAARGCSEAGYRLQGAAVDRICAVSVGDDMRLLTAFPAPGEVWVLLIGPHDEQNPDVDVYRSLYRVLGLDDYPPGDPDHPDDCCLPDNSPPVDQELFDRFLDGTHELSQERRRGGGHRRTTRRRRRNR